MLGGGEPEHAAKVDSFLGGALSSSARAPLPGQLTTFSHAIDAPSSQLRIQVRSLSEPRLLGLLQTGVANLMPSLAHSSPHVADLYASMHKVNPAV